MYWPLKYRRIAEHWRETTSWGQLFQRYQQQGFLVDNEDFNLATRG